MKIVVVKVTEERKETMAEKEAWRLLNDAVVRYCGSPVGTVAANVPSAEALNYDQVFIRDFVPSTIAFLLKGETEILRNFLLHTLQLQSWEKTVDCYSPGQGLMPFHITALSFHIREYYWVDMKKINEIYHYKTEEYSQGATNKFNIYPEQIPSWLVDWIPEKGGYLIGNLQPAHMDFKFFSLGNIKRERTTKMASSYDTGWRYYQTCWTFNLFWSIS